MALNLKREDKEPYRLLINDTPVRHLASQHRHDRSVMWDDGIQKSDWQKLEGNPGAIVAASKWKGFQRELISVFVVKDDEEISLYEIL